MPDSPREELYYFCDETSFMREEYMCVGGFAIRKGRIPEIVRLLSKLREQRGTRGEIKWESTRDGNLPIRRDYIDFMAKLGSGLTI